MVQIERMSATQAWSGNLASKFRWRRWGATESLGVAVDRLSKSASYDPTDAMLLYESGNPMSTHFKIHGTKFCGHAGASVASTTLWMNELDVCTSILFFLSRFEGFRVRRAAYPLGDTFSTRHMRWMGNEAFCISTISTVY